MSRGHKGLIYTDRDSKSGSAPSHVSTSLIAVFRFKVFEYDPNVSDHFHLRIFSSDV
jgi:hypothetical protein